jgi:ATP-dependent helicase/nuclease subunit A
MAEKAPKPAGSSWTDEQWEAIRARGHNLLVAAAAGSGKTAVLVERIIRKVMDEQQPVDVDRLLVATFTKAAASEMRERIREALQKALLANPDSTHLRRQLAFVHRASITTLHSFCTEVIRRYFQLIDLDPGFRVADDTEAELLRQDLLSDLLEEHYGESGEDSHFYRLVDWFSGDKSDDALFKLIQELYDFSRSHPKPDEWLDEAANRFAEPSNGSMSLWQEHLLADVRMELRAARGELEEALQLAGLPGGPAPYIDNLMEDLKLANELLAASGTGWDSVYSAFQTAAFGKLKACRGDDVDKELQEQVKGLRDRAKKKLGAIADELFARSSEQFAAELEELGPLIRLLVELVKQFGQRYQVEKRSKRLLDYSDLEHYCLQILLDSSSDEPGEMKPSAAALDYQEQFEEVLVDEYQDTNMVQETIIRLISRPGAGNRFMVGDVKQSIYRFRLAEPGLFLQKYKSYRTGDVDELTESTEYAATEEKAAEGIGADAFGQRIDLARNFRSRQEVVDAVNFIFRQIMHESAAEIDYDRSAELVCGASYPEWQARAHDLSAELMLIDRGAGGQQAGASGSPEEDGGFDAEPSVSGQEEDEEEQAETARLEARAIAAQIRGLIGMEGTPPFPVYDRKTGGTRPASFRDMVILLRATQAWSPVLIEELQLASIPAYADLNTGYFSAVEVGTLLSLLQIIDNPLQDIPLAAVLRSPIVGLTADELAEVRLASRRGPFYDAVEAFRAKGEQADEAGTALYRKVSAFVDSLESWREEARQGSLAGLIWRLYRETGYFDLVGGMPGGVQRQANLRALYDRARQYEATSFRGLFRFLRFIERMRDSGGDLGTARALGEQEDVVRIMTIHKSKGLEFPVVFVAGLGKSFNRQDLNGSFLLHKQLGFGPRFVDTERRIGYPTLASLAIKRRMNKEMLAEEMRVLYVALTRPKEKLYLVGTVKSLAKELEAWGRSLECRSMTLPDYRLVEAKRLLDWIVPSVLRHSQASLLRDYGAIGGGIDDSGRMADVPAEVRSDASQWKISIIAPESLPLSEAAAASESHTAYYDRWNALKKTEPVDIRGSSSSLRNEVQRLLTWNYPHQDAVGLFSKTSVTELKRSREQAELSEEAPAASIVDGLDVGSRAAVQAESGFLTRAGGPSSAKRPRFMERRKLNAAERGTAYHAVMQYIPLKPGLARHDVEQTMDEMVLKELLTEEQRSSIDPEVIHAFFASDIGRRLLSAHSVKRELPFSYALIAGEVYAEAQGDTREDTVLIQGVIDCLFEEEDGWVLLDYKTDSLAGRTVEEVSQRYRLQIELYRRAVEHIWGRPVIGAYLYFFDGRVVATMGE